MEFTLHKDICRLIMREKKHFAASASRLETNQSAIGSSANFRNVIHRRCWFLMFHFSFNRCSSGKIEIIPEIKHPERFANAVFKFHGMACKNQTL